MINQLSMIHRQLIANERYSTGSRRSSRGKTAHGLSRWVWARASGSTYTPTHTHTHTHPKGLSKQSHTHAYPHFRHQASTRQHVSIETHLTAKAKAARAPSLHCYLPLTARAVYLLCIHMLDDDSTKTSVPFVPTATVVSCQRRDCGPHSVNRNDGPFLNSASQSPSESTHTSSSSAFASPAGTVTPAAAAVPCRSSS